MIQIFFYTENRAMEKLIVGENLNKVPKEKIPNIIPIYINSDEMVKAPYSDEYYLFYFDKSKKQESLNHREQIIPTNYLNPLLTVPTANKIIQSGIFKKEDLTEMEKVINYLYNKTFNFKEEKKKGLKHLIKISDKTPAIKSISLISLNGNVNPKSAKRIKRSLMTILTEDNIFCKIGNYLCSHPNLLINTYKGDLNLIKESLYSEGYLLANMLKPVIEKQVIFDGDGCHINYSFSCGPLFNRNKIKVEFLEELTSNKKEKDKIVEVVNIFIKERDYIPIKELRRLEKKIKDEVGLKSKVISISPIIIPGNKYDLTILLSKKEEKKNLLMEYINFPPLNKRSDKIIRSLIRKEEDMRLQHLLKEYFRGIEIKREGSAVVIISHGLKDNFNGFDLMSSRNKIAKETSIELLSWGRHFIPIINNLGYIICALKALIMAEVCEGYSSHIALRVSTDLVLLLDKERSLLFSIYFSPFNWKGESEGVFPLLFEALSSVRSLEALKKLLIGGNKKIGGGSFITGMLRTIIVETNIPLLSKGKWNISFDLKINLGKKLFKRDYEDSSLLSYLFNIYFFRKNDLTNKETILLSLQENVDSLSEKVSEITRREFSFDNMSSILNSLKVFSYYLSFNKGKKIEALENTSWWLSLSSNIGKNSKDINSFEIKKASLSFGLCTYLFGLRDIYPSQILNVDILNVVGGVGISLPWLWKGKNYFNHLNEEINSLVREEEKTHRSKEIMIRMIKLTNESNELSEEKKEEEKTKINKEIYLAEKKLINIQKRGKEKFLDLHSFMEIFFYIQIDILGYPFKIYFSPFLFVIYALNYWKQIKLCMLAKEPYPFQSFKRKGIDYRGIRGPQQSAKVCYPV